jgi:protein-S-isoprenylcysteine O-methyltransferase Ste14
MTIDQALRLWFRVLYAFGIVGFLSNVLRIRRARPAFEQQIGPLPEVGAFVAWFLAPLILLSGIGQMAVEQPILRAKFGAAYEAYEAQTGRLLPRIWGRRS